MSHSKLTKRGRSHYLEVFNPEAKRFVVQCVLCGTTGFAPGVLAPDFADSPVRKVVVLKLQEVLEPLALNEAGQCEDCAGVANAN